jgi:hypothetical protein
MDTRVTRLRQGFAGSSVLVRRSFSEGGSPRMTSLFDEVGALYAFGSNPPRKRGIQYAAAPRYVTAASGILDRPVKAGR